MKVIFIPNMTGAFGSVTKELVKRKELVIWWIILLRLATEWEKKERKKENRKIEKY